MTRKPDMLLLYYLLITWTLSCGVSEDTPSREDANDHDKDLTKLTTFEAFTFQTMTVPLSTMQMYNPTLDLMEFYIQTEQKVIGYLASFRNEFQRTIVETQIKFCPYETLCDFTVDAYTDKISCCKPCLCNKCNSEKSCCPSVMGENEFIIATINSTKQFHQNSTSWHLEETGGNAIASCTLQHLTLRPSYEQKGFLANSNCPRDVDDLLRYNCTRPYTKDLQLGSVLPVLSNKSLEAFRNKFCAFCNGVTETDLVYFHPIFSCSAGTNTIEPITSLKDIIDLVFATQECDLKFANLDTRVELQECKYFVSKCNVTGSWTEYDVYLEVACHAYESLFMHEKYVFRNVFCAMCNGMDPHTVTCDSFPTLTTYIFSFSGLLKLDYAQGFSTSYLEDGESVHESSCNVNQIMDILTNRSKDLFCPEMRMLRNGHCVNMYESMIDFYSYTFYVRIKPLTFMTLADAFGNQSNWFIEIQHLFRSKYPNLALCDAQLAFKANKHYRQSASSDLSGAALLYVDTRVCLSVRDFEPWTIADNLLKLHGTSFDIFNERNESTKFVAYVMDKDDRLFTLIKQISGMSELHYDIMSIPNTNERINILAQYAMTDTDGLTLLPYSLQFHSNHDCAMASREIDVIRFSACPKVNISKLDISWTQTVDGLTIKGLKVQSNEYYYADHLHIMICTETFKKLVNHLQPDRTITAEIVVSIASCSLSVISLLITLTVFSIFPKLRTPLPGKNNMSLAASLMVAQVMLLVGSLAPFQQYSLSCISVGMIIHFSWLYAVFWMNVCTYHMFRVLSQTKNLSLGQGWKRFIFYHIYVCTMSIICVLANVVSSVFISDNIGYGGKFCYIISEEKVLYTFGIPTFLVVAANLSMFLTVVIKIKRSPNIRKNVRNDRNDIFIFAKLSTITGITWLFGFLHTWTSIKVFSYIFIVLNAGQGVFILLAFVANHQVLLLIQELKTKYLNKGLVTSRPKSSGSGKCTVSSRL